MLPGMAGGMVSKAGVNTAPSVRGTATYVSSAASTSHTLNLPSGIQSGDLLYVFWRSSSSGTDMSALPSGWLWYAGDSPLVKIASGSEGTTLATSWAGSVNVAAVAVCISGNRNGTSTSEIAVAFSSGGIKDPPASTPSWGLENNLWIAVVEAIETNATVATWPSEFTLDQTSAVHTTASCAVHVAFKKEEASTVDPSEYGLNNIGGSFTGISKTLAVRPL